MYKPSGMRAQLGTSIHAGTAAFDQGRIDGSGVSADDAAGVFVDTLTNPEHEVDYEADDLPMAKAEQIGLSLLTQYCIDIAPQFEFEAVEMETKPYRIDCGNGVTIELTGTLDRARRRRECGRKGISDIKTGARAVEKGRAKTRPHVAQLGVYELLDGFTTGEPCTAPAEIIGMKTSGKQEIATGEVENPTLLLIGDEDSPGLIEMAADMFKRGAFYPNPNSMLCNQKYCARWNTCRYHY